MPIIRVVADVELPEEHVPSERQMDVIAQRANNALHQVCLDGMQIPDDEVTSNSEPNYTVHIHNGTGGNYCSGCLAIAQDNRR